jgi:hypothetical protein
MDWWHVQLTIVACFQCLYLYHCRMHFHVCESQHGLNSVPALLAVNCQKSHWLPMFHVVGTQSSVGICRPTALAGSH